VRLLPGRVRGLQDRKVIMWDLRAHQAQASMDTPAAATIAMDEEGMVFAVGVAGGVVSMFDARAYEHGPFLSFPLPLAKYRAPATSPLACLKFSVVQNHLLAVVENRAFLMDTFDGHEIACWDNGAPPGAPPLEASFSADGRYILSGDYSPRDSGVLKIDLEFSGPGDCMPSLLT
jgi:COMPASS component SWD2